MALSLINLPAIPPKPSPSLTTEMRAVSALGNAHIEPTVFSTHGDLETVIDSTLSAIQREQGRDIESTGNATKLSPRNGALTLDDGSKTRFAYTHGAYEQLVEKLHGAKVRSSQGIGHETSPSKFSSVALWASAEVRPLMHAEMVKLARHGRKTQVFRLAHDAHNSDPAKRNVEYVRAVVSERHSAGSGDDTAFFAALSEFVSAERFAEFHAGQAYVRRDPAGETVGRVDSRKKLTGNARVTVGFRNNEIGEGAATVSSALVFEISARATFGRDVEPVRVEISVPGTRGSARSIHLGNGPASMFSAFAESLMFTLSWAPNAVLKMRTATLSQARVDSLRASLCKNLEGRDLRARQTEIGAFIERIGTDGVADTFSALTMILTLTHFGNVRDAQALVSEFAGQVG